MRTWIPGDAGRTVVIPLPRQSLSVVRFDSSNSGWISNRFDRNSVNRIVPVAGIVGFGRGIALATLGNLQAASLGRKLPIETPCRISEDNTMDEQNITALAVGSAPDGRSATVGLSGNRS